SPEPQAASGARNSGARTSGALSALPETKAVALAQVARHAPADRQRLGAAAQAHEPASVGGSLDRVEVVRADERIAMDAHEPIAVLLLERPQRVLDQVLPARMPHRRVLLIGNEAVDLLERDQPHPVAMSCGDARERPASRLCQAMQPGTREPLGARERGAQLLLAHGLQQISNR